MSERLRRWRTVVGFAMRVKRLYLKDYRNYASVTVDLPAGVLVFEGPNGAGKTNLLEAVYFLSMCRSFRLGRDRDVVSRGASSTLVRAEAAGRDGAVSFALEYDLKMSEKRATYNGNRIFKLTDYAGTLPAVAFHPQDLEIVKGPPVLRRRFLDHWLAQYDRRYIYLLKRYNDALSQRNALLRLYGGSAFARPECEAITETMVEAGAGIVKTRGEKLAELAEFAASDYAALTGDGEELAVDYLPDTAGAEDRDLFRAALFARAKDEQRFKRTLVGPHLDDVAFQVSGFDARRFASQGQQRSVVLALRLAQFKVTAMGSGETPILLLDDAFSELDRDRIDHLAETVSAAEQVWVTTTRRLDGFVGTRFTVTDGVVSRV
jgi:DNA replication and repair protein RecF